jgi:hypothetical protein
MPLTFPANFSVVLLLWRQLPLLHGDDNEINQVNRVYLLRRILNSESGATLLIQELHHGSAKLDTSYCPPQDFPNEMKGTKFIVQEQTCNGIVAVIQ